MDPPPQHVLDAFDVTDPHPLSGGTGRSWAAGPLVLKPLDMSPDELRWQASVLRDVHEDGFRVSPPDTRVVDGWTAWRRVEGVHRSAQWTQTIEVGERFHAALAHVARPEFLDARTDPWSVGDRAAWGEAPLDPWSEVHEIADLQVALEPVELASSVVHGDLTANVLYSDVLPPAVIDFSPYWRPRGYASAIVVADALLWENGDETLVSLVDRRLLVRALIFRAVTELVAHGSLRSEYARVSRLCT